MRQSEATSILCRCCQSSYCSLWPTVNPHPEFKGNHDRRQRDRRSKSKKHTDVYLSVSHGFISLFKTINTLLCISLFMGIGVLLLCSGGGAVSLVPCPFLLSRSGPIQVHMVGSDCLGEYLGRRFQGRLSLPPCLQ